MPKDEPIERTSSAGPRSVAQRRGESVDNLARMFRALGNPNRLRLFMNLLEESKLDLAKGRVHDCFLVKLLGGLGDLGAPTVSHHVKELSGAGLIQTPREGKQLICSVDPEGLAQLREALTVKA